MRKMVVAVLRARPNGAAEVPLEGADEEVGEIGVVWHVRMA